MVTALFMPLNASSGELAGRNLDPGLRMRLPLAILTATIIVLGVSSVTLIQFLNGVAYGLF